MLRFKENGEITEVLREDGEWVGTVQRRPAPRFVAEDDPVGFTLQEVKQIVETMERLDANEDLVEWTKRQWGLGAEKGPDDE